MALRQGADPLKQDKGMEKANRRWVRIYEVVGGDLLDPKGDVTIRFVGEHGTRGDASLCLHSKEFREEHLRAKGRPEAQFLVIADHQHFLIAPASRLPVRTLIGSGGAAA